MKQPSRSLGPVLACAFIVLSACADSRSEPLSEAEESWCGGNALDVWRQAIEQEEFVHDEIDTSASVPILKWNSYLNEDPFTEESMLRALSLLETEVPEAYEALCRDAIDESARQRWSIESEAKRLLSDGSWIWCSDNRDSVEEVGRELGLGDREIEWSASVSAAEFFRACVAAAEARGGATKEEPGDVLIQVARRAGYTDTEETILDAGLFACRKFDESGVNQLSVDATVVEVFALLSTPDTDGVLFPAEVMVGAASAAICPEYAEAVAAFG